MNQNSTVHIWIAGLRPTPLEIDEAQFPPEERKRAVMFLRNPDRLTLLQRRQFIHETVAPVFQLPPDRCEVAHHADGRPYLRGTDTPWLIHLSISTAVRNVAVAASAECAIGVDLEPVMPADADLLGRVLSTHERCDIEQTDIDTDLALTAYWTRKEAYLKLRGIGLRQEPNTMTMPPFSKASLGNWQEFSFNGQYSLITWQWRDCLCSLCVAGTDRPRVQLHI